MSVQDSQKYLNKSSLVLSSQRLVGIEATQALLDALVSAVWIYDIENYGIVWANRAALVLWESESLEELCSRDFSQGSSDAVQQTLLDYQVKFKQGEHLSRLWRISPKGVLKQIFCHLSGVELADGRTAMLVEASTEVNYGEDDTSAVITLSTYAINGDFLSGNPPFLETQDNNFANLSQLFAHRDDYLRISKTLEYAGSYHGDVQINCNQQVLWHRLVISVCEQEQGHKRILLQQFNIEQRKQKEIALEKEVVTDPLTGLLNRRGLKQVIADKSRFFIFYMDLDGFKLVNDSLGHNAGDQLLKHLALKLTTGSLESGYACRCGGDEFIWLIEESRLFTCVEDMANLLIKLMNQPYYCQEVGQNISVSASIGIAHYPEDGAGFEDLVVKADAAMYVAKAQGKHRWVNYTAGMEKSLQRQSRLAQYLYKAQANGEFELHYQPIVDTTTQRVTSLEALLRWRSPELGLVPTDECIRVAEEIGIITDIESWVIKTAIANVNEFRGLFDDKVTVSVNVSGKYFASSNFVGYLEQELTNQGLTGDAINVELTETTVLSDAHKGCKTALTVASRGIAISIDDFGTGYSSLSYLHKIPATFVKIDKSFTDDCLDDATMLASIKQLLNSLNFEIVVEGVETLEQSNLLQQMGLTLQQGYGLGWPQPLSYYQDKK